MTGPGTPYATSRPDMQPHGAPRVSAVQRGKPMRCAGNQPLLSRLGDHLLGVWRTASPPRVPAALFAGCLSLKSPDQWPRFLRATCLTSDEHWSCSSEVLDRRQRLHCPLWWNQLPRGLPRQLTVNGFPVWLETRRLLASEFSYEVLLFKMHGGCRRMRDRRLR
jgi:hypothetical protein